MIAGITRFIINYKKKHPYKDAVAIDYSAAMILMPAIFLGSSIGVMMHSILPDIVPDLLLLLLLVYCIFESIKKGIKFWKQESLERIKNYNIEVHAPEEIEPLQNYQIGQVSSSGDQIPILNYSNNGKSEATNSRAGSAYTNELVISKMGIDAIETLQQKDRTHWQFDKLIPIWVVLVALVIQNLFRSGTVGGVKKCSPGYWIIYVLYIIVCLIVVLYCMRKSRRDIYTRKQIKFPSYRGEVKFNPKRITIVCSVSILAGTIAAVVGIGGSPMYIPLLLAIGYPPFVASSTSMLIVMYSSTGNVISYSLQNKVYFAYGAWYALWTTLGVVFGVIGANKIVKKTGRQSLFIFLLAGLLILGTVFSIVFNTMNIIDEVNDGKNIFKFNGFCN